MSGLQITVTSAGRAAQVNAENTGTAPVTIAQIGITDQVVVPDEAMTALPGELKRLVTFAGAAVAADTIHVTIRDDSADVYSMRGFALYLADGTLYAVYGQADVILEKSAQAMMLLAADIIFANIDATSLTFGDTNWINPPATTEVQGVIEVATPAEANTGTDPGRAVAPSGLKHTLDTRFGAGAPSAFVKGLLPLATAVLFRSALEIRSAALKDEGSGNGLNADLLDGQHGAHYLAWANQTGVPPTFPAAAHGHSWGELSGVPVYATRWPAWDEVSGKPLAFTPSPHSHDSANIVSGTLSADRIPVLDFGKVAGLSAALADRYTQAQIGLIPGAFSSGYYGFKGMTAFNADWGILLSHNGSSASLQGSSYVRLRGGATAVLDVMGSGAQITGSVTATAGFGPGSSRHLKTGLRALPYGLAEVERIVTRVGRYRPEYNPDGKRRLFVIAEQLATVVPEAVMEDLVDFGDRKVAAVDYMQLVPVLIRAVQELSAEVRALKAS